MIKMHDQHELHLIAVPDDRSVVDTWNDIRRDVLILQPGEYRWVTVIADEQGDYVGTFCDPYDNVKSIRRETVGV
jgi:hypothetical protein